MTDASLPSRLALSPEILIPRKRLPNQCRQTRSEDDPGGGQISHNIALNSLDFAHKQSLCGRHGGTVMTQNIPAISIADFLKCIRERPDEAAVISKATEPCAAAGHPEKGVTIKGLQSNFRCVRLLLKIPFSAASDVSKHRE
jgi:hypothetical protein